MSGADRRPFCLRVPDCSGTLFALGCFWGKIDMKRVIRENLAVWIAVILCAAVWLTVQLSGLRLCAVQTGSMEPTISTYSLCLVTTQVDYDDLAVGDIVVYTRSSDGRQIIHRVVEFTDGGAITKGDANHSDDGVSVTPDNLYARYIAHIPGGARVFNVILSPAGLAVMLLLAAALILPDVVGRRRRKRG